jgi:FkbM family methyltransferase
MNVPFKVKVLNVFRSIFKIAPLESLLASWTQGKSPMHFVCKWVPNPYQYTPATFRSIKRNGIALRLDISDYIGHYIYFGFADPAQNRLFSLCQEHFNVLDIGTNIGWTAMNFAGIAKQGRVLGFEPDAYNFQRCSENLSLNNFANLKIYQLGVGDNNQETFMELRTPTNRGGNRVAASSAITANEIKIVKLDDFAPVNDFISIDLVKIDVEGYELHVLRGAQKLLQNHKPILFIEVDDNNLRDQGNSASQLIEFILEIGYGEIVHAENNQLITADTDFNNCHFDIIAR